jgi:hypothetical protein
MTIKHVALNSFTPAQATIINGVVIDGYVDGQPMQFIRTADNRIKPAIGTTVHTSYGTGQVVGYTESNRLRVAISQFNEDFEFITADESDIYDAEEYVSRIARSMNVGIASSRETFERLYKSEITGKLSPRNEDRMTAAFQWFDDNEVVVSGSNKSLEPTDMVVARIIGDGRETPAERKARIKRERALATKLANAMLSVQSDDSDDAVPADILAEMNECFGE